MATATETQARRTLTVSAPAGAGALPLRLVGFKGQEGLSQLFLFQLTMTAPSGTDIPFDKLLGQKVSVTVEQPGAKPRIFHGICKRMSQAGSEAGGRTTYRMDVVPQLWLLTRRAQTRTFQQMSVPDILKEVLAKVVDFEFRFQASTFRPRDYCVQYRETDFNFVSRLMEEEGIYYYFTHAADGHKMILGNAPEHHYEIPAPGTVIYDSVRGGHKNEVRVYDWEKAQELRSGKYTLWDHCFEMPDKNLAADRTVPATVTVGGVTHKLLVAGNDRLEIYDYPGEFAQRFDGVAPGGGDRSSDLSGIQADGDRTTRIRLEQETAAAVVIRGAGDCTNFVAGHAFTLKTQEALGKHAQADGKYVVTGVAHSAHYSGDERSDGAAFHYSNHFTCIPAAMPFRPARVTPKPAVQGSQTATVVGPQGQEIFTDKYGRVKVQFHWDREGKNDAGSSCWCRVSTLWAGKQWGMIHIPRIGQEVIVDFLEGDPDQPIITGSVYNAEMMPPYALPDNQTQSGIKSRSTLNGTPQNFNEFRFEDKKGHEQVFLHAEKNQDIEVENDETHWVGHDRQKTIDHDETTHVKHDRTETVDHDETITIGNNRTETVGKDETITIGSNRTETVGKDERIEIDGKRTESVGKDESVTVGGSRSHTVGGNDELTVGKALTITAADQITLTTGSASIVMKKDGTIAIKGKDILVDGTGKITAKSASDMTLKGSKIGQN